MAGKYSQRLDDGPLGTWYVERLWKLAATLPIKKMPIEEIKCFHKVGWFSDEKPATCMEVTKHAKRMLAADLRFPVILTEKGDVMDGMHRIGKAWLEGLTEIDVVQFATNPEPDEVRP